jgi:FkbM family methyltransferase
MTTERAALLELASALDQLPADWHAASTLDRGTLAAIARHAPTRVEHSIEFGAGRSTILLSRMSPDHWVFSLDHGGSVTAAANDPRLRSECVHWILGPVQQTLAGAALPAQLDVALLDGPHAYPWPDVQLSRIFPLLRPGSLLIVSAIHIPSIRNLFDFLCADPRLTLAELYGTAALFKRTTVPDLPSDGDYWWEQQYNQGQFPATLPSTDADPREVDGEKGPAPASVHSLPLEILEHNLPRQHYSHYGQDMLVGDILFRSRQGVFVDVGARDGKIISNTYYLEKELGWTGIAIEPHPDFFQQLVETRSCRCVNVAAGAERAELEFVKLLEPPFDNSGLLSTFRDPDWLERIRHEIITVPVLPLSEIITDLQVIHYLDIDVEGHELAVLQGIDFSRVEIRVIGVEAGKHRDAIDGLLAQHGFRPFLDLRADRFYCVGGTPSVDALLRLP